jgi:hypothetical protein
MSELADFLLARIAEDEAVACGAQRSVDALPAGATVFHRADLPHIARWNPARVLAECEAKRRIVGRLAAADRYAATGGVTTEYAEGYDHGILDAARFLALPYADHPDYRSEWTP